MSISESIENKLRDYYNANGIDPDNFTCKNLCRCVNPGGYVLARGMQCHIGEKYGEKMRILVASLDCGDGGIGTIENRRNDVVSKAQKDTRNPHMRGTFKSLSYFLDEKEPSKLVHYMVMINTCKCCRIGSTNQMGYKYFLNCGEYTIGEIMIAEPEVILFQGKNSYVGCYDKLLPVEGIEDTEIKQSLRFFTHQGLRCYAVLCIHPSARFKYTKARIKFYDETLPKIADYIKTHPLL